MGVMLPKPVMSKINERMGNENFRVGSSCVNGYRENMEDAHIIYLQNKWGFFGVFDGHVNDQCSAYLEVEWKDRLEKITSVPITDDKMKEMALQIDKKFLDAKREGGSTGTFFLAHVLNADTIHLQVGNVGDSRVLVCRNGACAAMTTDHKPINDGERRRIEACGGRVENNRVDGSLAVSRAFGDGDYKRSGGDQLFQKVIALPDVTHIDVSRDDFAVLACDGVFEGNFSNEEVIEFTKEQLKTSNDLAYVSGKVCEEAIIRGSKDNISCMIVQFCPGLDYGAEKKIVFEPGPYSVPTHSGFRRAYASMAEKAKVSVEMALEQRYDFLVSKSRTSDEESELGHFRGGPPASLKGADRTAWFVDLFGVGRDGSPTRTAASEQLERMQVLQQQIGIPLPMLLELMAEVNQGGGAGGK